ncbi:hypothetical protein AWZ03_013267 [Drosophila navojoa]|uniref:Uncharacterized protein n=1 Tax=Drosophila navojoa TaxID=7232 RepID=A0A484AV75_DRONA|nr:hypothetical protein AWZ03_013267 [Drosophila navojoa]
MMVGLYRIVRRVTLPVLIIYWEGGKGGEGNDNGHGNGGLALGGGAEEPDGQAPSMDETSNGAEPTAASDSRHRSCSCILVVCEQQYSWKYSQRFTNLLKMDW